MPRPVDQVTADERAKGRPGLVRLAAPRYPERFPDTVRRVVDGRPVFDAAGKPVFDPHPKAGQPHPQANQVVRNTVQFRDGGERISVHSTGPAFWNSDGTAVDSDLTSGPPGFLAAAPNVGFGFRVRVTGEYWYAPDPADWSRRIEVGPLRYSDGKPLPHTRPRVVEHRVEWDTPQGVALTFCKPGLLDTWLTLSGPEHNTGWSWTVTFIGITPEKAYQCHWEDAAGGFGTLPVTVTGDQHSVGPLPDGLPYPVLVVR